MKETTKKSRMTKQEKKMKSMLNYFEIEVGSGIDEDDKRKKTKSSSSAAPNEYTTSSKPSPENTNRPAGRSSLEELLRQLSMRNNSAKDMQQQDHSNKDEDENLNTDFSASSYDEESDDDEMDEIDNIIDELNQLYREGTDGSLTREEGIQKFIDWLSKTLTEGVADVIIANNGSGITQIIIRNHKNGGKRN